MFLMLPAQFKRIRINPLALNTTQISLDCWDCGFESRRRHGALSVVNDVCCQVDVSAKGRSLVQRSPTERLSLNVIIGKNNHLHLT
jgi:hypothetical protein